MTRVAYQGVPGAYSEECAAALFPRADLSGERTFGAVFAALDDGRVDAAVLPVENSTAGAVSDVYDLLQTRPGVAIGAEAVLRVRHCLLGVPGARLEDVTRARSHPQALAQCDAFLEEHGIEPVATYDTAGAAHEVRALADARVAAVASRRAAERAGLIVLAEDIASTADNLTRFFALGRRSDGLPLEEMPAEHLAGAPKSSLAFATEDRPGALVRALQPFAAAGVNLAKIESRPSRETPWSYVFYLDLHGDVSAAPAKDALDALRGSSRWVRVLGTYPMAVRPLSG